jgi:hypothetical protein
MLLNFLSSEMIKLFKDELCHINRSEFVPLITYKRVLPLSVTRIHT